VLVNNCLYNMFSYNTAYNDLVIIDPNRPNEIRQG